MLIRIFSRQRLARFILYTDYPWSIPEGTKELLWVINISKEQYKDIKKYIISRKGKEFDESFRYKKHVKVKYSEGNPDKTASDNDKKKYALFYKMMSVINRPLKKNGYPIDIPDYNSFHAFKGKWIPGPRFINRLRADEVDWKNQNI